MIFQIGPAQCRRNRHYFFIIAGISRSDNHPEIILQFVILQFTAFPFLLKEFVCYNNLTALAEAKLPTPERALNHDKLCMSDDFSA
jgi:hypothetical protein